MAIQYCNTLPKVNWQILVNSLCLANAEWGNIESPRPFIQFNSFRFTIPFHSILLNQSDCNGNCVCVYSRGRRTNKQISFFLFFLELAFLCTHEKVFFPFLWMVQGRKGRDKCSLACQIVRSNTHTANLFAFVRNFPLHRNDHWIFYSRKNGIPCLFSSEHLAKQKNAHIQWIHSDKKFNWQLTMARVVGACQKIPTLTSTDFTTMFKAKFWTNLVNCKQTLPSKTAAQLASRKLNFFNQIKQAHIDRKGEKVHLQKGIFLHDSWWQEVCKTRW